MTKPQFLQIKKYEGDYMEDDEEEVISWIKSTYFRKIQAYEFFLL